MNLILFFLAGVSVLNMEFSAEVFLLFLFLNIISILLKVSKRVPTHFFRETQTQNQNKMKSGARRARGKKSQFSQF